MKERRLAVCDKDEKYLEMMQSYLLKKKPSGFEILTFSSVYQAVEASSEEGFTILFLGENTYDANVVNINALKIFILQEDGQSGIKGYSHISKYQSMEVIMGQALDEFALDEGCASIAGCGKNKTRLISFYSPDRHSGQTIASLCAGEVLADMGRKVLYLNLSAFSGFEKLLGTTYDSDITDFMYFALKRSDKLLYKLEGIKRTLHGMDYLPPALDYADFMRISEEDWRQVFDTLLYSGDYTHVVADLTEVCQGFYHILDRSDQVYLLNKAGTVRTQAMRNHYQEVLLAKQYGRIMEKTQVFDLNENWEAQSANLENLSMSGIGVHMKGVLQGYEY